MDTGSETLTERYVHAAVRTTPERQRDDLAAELRASIADQVDARTDRGESATDAERSVLLELGDPDKLAASYTGRRLYLIGPDYYLTWWRLLKVLLAIVPVCAGFGVVLAKYLTGAELGDIVGTAAVVLVNVIVQITFWTTVLFVVVERSRSATTSVTSAQWTPELLPVPRTAKSGIPELTANLIYVAVIGGAILWDQLIGFVPGQPELSLLNPSLWPWWIVAALIMLALQVLLAVGVYRKKGWDLGSATVNLFLDLTVVGAVLWLTTTGQLINLEFFSTLTGASGDTVTGILSTVAGAVTIALAMLSIIDGYRRARPSLSHRRAAA